MRFYFFNGSGRLCTAFFCLPNFCFHLSQILARLKLERRDPGFGGSQSGFHQLLHLRRELRRRPRNRDEISHFCISKLLSSCSTGHGGFDSPDGTRLSQGPFRFAATKKPQAPLPYRFCYSRMQRATQWARVKWLEPQWP